MSSLLDKLKRFAVGSAKEANMVRVAIGKQVVARPYRGIAGAIEAANPWDSESKGNELINQVSQLYQTTPAFTKLLSSQNPHVSNSIGGGSGLNSGYSANGMYTDRKGRNPYAITGINVSGEEPAPTLLHEGLHAQWDNDPSIRNNFISTYNSSSTPELRAWLSNRLSGYRDFRNAPPDSLANIRKLPESLQTEVHSYLPEYYNTQGYRDPGRSAAAQYYKPYFNIYAQPRGRR